MGLKSPVLDPFGSPKLGTCRSTQKGVTPDGLKPRRGVFHGDIHTSWVDPQDPQKE